MTVRLIDPKLCLPNRYQPADRITFTPRDLADLESIREKLLYEPKVRVHPDRPGFYEICYGHRRTAAWILYRPGELMPADVCDLSDWELFAEQAIENGQRVNLNAIQKANVIATAIEVFHRKQYEAAALVGLRTQSAVSNLLSLLKLPPELQAAVAKGDIPERIGRELARMVKRQPLGLEVIAEAVIAAPPSDKEEVFKRTTAALAAPEEPAPEPPPPAATVTPDERRKRKEKKMHKSAHVLKPKKDEKPLPPRARREVVAMAEAAAATITTANPKRDAILKAIERMCKQWKVSLPEGWKGE
jgi:ParB/RepB/Spo0J family partition protein